MFFLLLLPRRTAGEPPAITGAPPAVIVPWLRPRLRPSRMLSRRRPGPRSRRQRLDRCTVGTGVRWSNAQEYLDIFRVLRESYSPATIVVTSMACRRAPLSPGSSPTMSAHSYVLARSTTPIRSYAPHGLGGVAAMRRKLFQTEDWTSPHRGTRARGWPLLRVNPSCCSKLVVTSSVTKSVTSQQARNKRTGFYPQFMHVLTAVTTEPRAS